MWPLLVLLIPLFGYMYVDTDHYLKYKLKKSDGWHAYFLVSVQGVYLLIMLFLGILQLLIVFWCIGAVISICFGAVSGIAEIINTSEVTFTSIFSILIENIGNKLFINYTDFIIDNLKYVYSKVTVNILSGILVVLMSVYTVSKSAAHYKQQESEDSIKKARSDIAKDSNVDEMIFQAEKLGLLIMVTLKSRKVYVGQVIGRELGYTDLKEISLIPILSGYRDKDTLVFKVSHDYSDYYDRANITESSNPPLSSFQQTVFYDQIESMSLFDSETYKKFQETKNSDDKIWKKFLKKAS